MFNMRDFLSKYTVKKINVGMSGADVYDIDNKYILKHVLREKLENEGLFLSYQHEAQFYQTINRKKLSCLPEVISVEWTDYEIQVLMKKYRMIEHREVNQDILAKIMKTIAMVHHFPVPDFLLHKRTVLEPLTVEQITDCVNGWLTVLRKHRGHFDEKPLEQIACRINSIIRWHTAGKTNLIHGDFHLNNLLFDNEGEIVICDWQSVAVGHSSNDLGFFLSRFNADGARISEKEVIDLYSKAVYELYGKTVDGESIHRHLAASTLITSFLFWHHFLHGVPKEKVEQVYCEMVGIISSYMFPII